MAESNLPPLKQLSHTLHPTTLWNQDSTSVTLKIQLSGVKSISLRVTEKQMLFWTEHEGKKYVLLISWFNEVSPSKSAHKLYASYVKLVVQKQKAGKWLRLTASTEKIAYIKPDHEALNDDDDGDALCFEEIKKLLPDYQTEKRDYEMGMPAEAISDLSDGSDEDDLEKAMMEYDSSSHSAEDDG